MQLKTKPTKGVKGYLLRTFTDDNKDTFVFRVYDRGVDGEFQNCTDYDILHYDLEMEILDDAVFYDDGVRQFIDYKDE